jgi:hypothetical protein
MPKGYKRVTCKICERHRDQVGDLSKRGKCQECATAMIYGNIEGLATHSGPFFAYWRLQVARGVGGHLDDERTPA